MTAVHSDFIEHLCNMLLQKTIVTGQLSNDVLLTVQKVIKASVIRELLIQQITAEVHCELKVNFPSLNVDRQTGLFKQSENTIELGSGDTKIDLQLRITNASIEANESERTISDAIKTINTTLKTSTAIEKTIRQVITVKELPRFVANYHKNLDWNRLFNGYWSSKYIENQFNAAKAIIALKVDLSVLADAVNPLFLAVWQQWHARRTADVKQDMWDNIKLISSEIKKQYPFHEYSVSLGHKYTNIELLFILMDIFKQLQLLADMLNQTENKQSNLNNYFVDLSKQSSLDFNASHKELAKLIAFCMLVEHRHETYGKKLCSTESKKDLLKKLNDISMLFLTSQKVLNNKKQAVAKISRVNLYIWLLYEITNCTKTENSEDISLLPSDTIYSDICYVTKCCCRFLLFSSDNYPFKLKPARLAASLLRLIDFHANNQLKVKLPPNLVQLIAESIDHESQFGQLVDATQHFQHVSDLYLNGQYFLSQLKDDSLTDLTKTKQEYALASLFHDIGMLKCHHAYLTTSTWKDKYTVEENVEYLKQLKFISSTEATNIHTYEYVEYQQHAFSSALMLHHEAKRHNLHLPGEQSPQLTIESPVIPAVRSILFHSMCYLPDKNDDDSLEKDLSAMTLALFDSIYTWRPSTTSIGNSQNIMSYGFGTAIEADLARFDDKRLEVVENKIFLLRETTIGNSLQYLLKLMQGFGRLSFNHYLNDDPVILLEVDDKAILLKELKRLSELLFHEVCDGIKDWINLQFEFCTFLTEKANVEHVNTDDEKNGEEESFTDIPTINLQRLKKFSHSISPEEIEKQVIIIPSNNKILGNFDVVKFMEIPRVRDFLKHRSRFH